MELETKLDKLTRELKTKEQEFENSLNTEKQNYQKMESYNNAQIKRKRANNIKFGSQNRKIKSRYLRLK